MAVEVATVTTASKKPEKASDAPATVIVITENDIRLRGYATLKDVLRDLPGMETIESYFSEFGTQVPVRGINGNNKIAVLVNGMRVNPPGGENFPFRSDFSVRNVERIEVIYGPGSTLYGQDAISAVINVITKTASAGAHGEVGVAGGLNSEREGWATFGGSLDRAGNVKLSGHVMYHDSELTRLDREYPNWWKSYGELARQHGSGDPPERQDFGVNVFARLTYQDSSLQVWHRESKRSSSESGYPPAYVDEALWQDESTVVEGRNTATLTEDVKLASMLTYNRYEIDPATRYVFAVPGLTNQWFLNDYKYGLGEGYTWEETLRMDLSDRISLLCGAMAGNYDIIPKSTAPGGADPDGDVVGEAGAWEYTVGSDPTRHPINRVARSEYQTYAGYTELAWRLDDRLRLVAGTRVTKDTRFDDLPITPRAALIYDLTESLIAKYIYSRAYVAPGPYFANATYDNGTLLATSNGDLEPEKAETHEVNLTYTRKRVSLGASAYYGEQSDIIVVSDFGSSGNIVAQDVFLDGDPAQRRTLVRTVNGGEGRRYGADLYGRATWGDACLWSSYSYVDSEETVGDMTRDAPGLSRHNARLGVTWAATSKLFVTPSLALRSTPQNTPAGELEDELSVPWDVNLHVLYQLTKQVDVFADLKNVTDHHYALAGFGNSGKAIPQETFHGMLGLRGVF
jgi:outer membrane receptor for ferrienterochelin and colicin